MKRSVSAFPLGLLSLVKVWWILRGLQAFMKASAVG